MKFYICIYCIFLITFLACNEQSNQSWVAKYQDEIITNTELKAVMPKGLSTDDSLKFVNQYIKNWVKSKVLISEKDNLLSEDEIKNIELKVAKYREDLTEIMIEDKLTASYSNTVEEKDLQQYYNDFPETFILKDDVLSYRIMKVPSDSARKYKAMLQENLETLTVLLKKNNYYFDFKDNNWVEKDKLLSTDLLPEKIKKQNLMVENQIYTYTQGENTLVFQTLKSGKAGNAAPYEYIKPTIKRVVLNKNKLNLLSQKKNELYEKAVENDEIKRK